MVKTGPRAEAPTRRWFIGLIGRACSSVASATHSDKLLLTSTRHLVNFLGTDTVAAMICARDYYGAKKAGTGPLLMLCVPVAVGRQPVGPFQLRSTPPLRPGASTVRSML